MLRFDISDWYFIVAESSTEVWSSALPGYVPVDDPAFVAWTDGGNVPTPMADILALTEIMRAQWLPRYLARNNIVITSPSNTALNDTYSLDVERRAKVSAVGAGLGATKSLPGNVGTFVHYGITGLPHIFNSKYFADFSTAILDYIYALENAMMGLINKVPDVTGLPSNAINIDAKMSVKDGVIVFD